MTILSRNEYSSKPTTPHSYQAVSVFVGKEYTSRAKSQANPSFHTRHKRLAQDQNSGLFPTRLSENLPRSTPLSLLLSELCWPFAVIDTFQTHFARRSLSLLPINLWMPEAGCCRTQQHTKSDILPSGAQKGPLREDQ